MPNSIPTRWWLTPLLSVIVLIGAATSICVASETAREVLTKAVMFIIGTVSTPFILETTVALVGLCAVITFNQWRLHKEGDGWVYLAQTEPDAASVAEGAETPAHRLDSVVVDQLPVPTATLQSQLAIAEGYLELGLAREALAHLETLGAEERALPQVEHVRALAEARLNS